MSEQKDRFRKALEQSRKGETIDLDEKEFELFSAIQNEGVTRAFRKDRPDREKIAEALYLRYGVSAIAPDSGLLLKWAVLGEEHKERWREDADQIIALIEEAKKQERKDVGLELQQWMSSNSLTSPYRYVDRVIEATSKLLKGQALKEGKR